MHVIIRIHYIKAYNVVHLNFFIPDGREELER
jgi:hypothetical protein